jgi:hypothetical protein
MRQTTKSERRAYRAATVISKRLFDAGLSRLVDFRIEPGFNDRDKKVLVIIAEYKAGSSTLTRSEDIDRFFCPEMFAKSLTRRAAYIKAGKAAQIAANEAGIHPDLYQAA